MAVDVDNIHWAITGAVSKAPTNTTAPTDATTALAGAWADHGAIHIDGVTLSLDASSDAEIYKIWQDHKIVRTKRTASDEVPTLTFTALETNKTVVETYFGVSVAQSVPHGTFDYKAGELRPYDSYVLDSIDGSDLRRFYIPKGIVTDVGDMVFNNEDEPIGYEITVAMDYHATLDLNMRAWYTALAQ